MIQVALAITFYISYSKMPNFSVTQAPLTTVILGRICCTIILHVQTEKFVRQGLNMAKFAINHPEDFSTPIIAALLGISHALTIMALTLAIIIHISAQQTFLDTLTAFVTYTATCNVQVFAYASLPPGNPLKPVSPPLVVKNHRRDIKHRRYSMWILRVIYKFLRIIYGAVWFYFLPMVVIVLPFVTVVIF